VVEKRRYARTSIDLPVTFTIKGGSARGEGTGRDISIGGIFIETLTPAGFAVEVVVRLSLRTSTGAMREFELPGVVRWVRADGMGVQFRLLGAHETHAITELSRTAG
jgi:type IV pilus assembly protein PilZ